MDPDLEVVWELFKHIYPDFNCNHIYLYKLLWRIEPRTAEFLIEESKLSRGTVYKVLRDLVKAGLVKKTSMKPVCYFAVDPAKTYGELSGRISLKLKKGNKQIKQLIENSSGLSGEFYLVERDGGQLRLLNKQTRQTALDDYADKIKKAIELQVREEERRKIKPWAMYR